MDDAAQISKMKVADLKKELKARGLPVTGNKTELVERLQQALEADGDVPLGAVEGEDEDFDEEEILGGDDDMDGVELGKMTPQEEEAALEGVISVRDEADLLEQPEKKKISLKRSDPPVPLSTPEASKENAVPETTSETNGATARKLIKLDTNEGTEEPKIEARAKRFGVSMTDEARKQARAERFNITAGESKTTSTTTTTSTTITAAADKTTDAAANKKPAKLSMETGGTDLEKLKARAQRFGEVTSNTLTKVSELERKKQRQERFSASGSPTKTEGSEKKPISNLDDAKAARAARFGAGTAVTSTDDEIKKKRAERFGNQ